MSSRGEAAAAEGGREKQKERERETGKQREMEKERVSETVTTPMPPEAKDETTTATIETQIYLEPNMSEIPLGEEEYNLKIKKSLSRSLFLSVCRREKRTTCKLIEDSRTNCSLN